MICRLIYTLLLGVFLAIFVGVGISAFYKGPTYPEMPAILKYCSPDAVNTTSFKTQVATYDKAEKVYRVDSEITIEMSQLLLLLEQVSSLC